MRFLICVCLSFIVTVAHLSSSHRRPFVSSLVVCISKNTLEPNDRVLSKEHLSKSLNHAKDWEEILLNYNCK